MALTQYHKKRDFKKTPEPKGKISKGAHHLYVIQKHAASHLHYDFRIELDGVLKSWAVPKGPSLDPNVKRLAMHVEDHPVEYGYFEGIIPKGEYGGGTVMLWDKGIWKPLDENPQKAYQKGHLRFELEAEKLNGRWDLIRFKDEQHWFLIKHQDDRARSDYDITEEQPLSVLSQRTMDEIRRFSEQVWTKKGLKKTIKPDSIKAPKLKIPRDLAKNPFPNFIPPQLATLVNEPPKGDEWLHEIKLDGYRILAFINQDKVILKSRSNKDWTEYFPDVVEDLQGLKLNSAVLDGEIVVLDKDGKSSFQLLQNSIKGNEPARFFYYVFDLLYYDQYNLMPLPQIDRKELLRDLLKNQVNSLRYSEHFKTSGDEVLKSACDMSLEGIISKQSQAPYTSKRSKSWLKIKCIKRQEFVIGGYTQPKGTRSAFGSLFLGVYNEKGELEFTGNVGTGFTEASLSAIEKKLKKYIQKVIPFNRKPPESKHATWVKPVLVAEVEFTEWTLDGHLRHPSFKGLRMDKKAKDIIKEVPKLIKKSTSKLKKSSFKITHPDKIIYPEDDIRKEDLLQYYEFISPLILPYIKNRPLTLLRCPKDYNQCFYQRHFNDASPKELKAVSITTKSGSEDYIYLTDKKGLLSLVQMGALEIHPWGSTINHIEHPNWITIDLDPAPDVLWRDIVAAALDVKDRLQQYGLTSFVKTTGGKGLHVVIPIKAAYDWEEISNFAHVFVMYMEQINPNKYISKMTKSKRVGKIFIDYLRNQRSATAISIYSTRARIHAPVSAPVHWDELNSDKRDTEFTVKNMEQRVGGLKKDPWELFLKMHQVLPL